MGGGGKKSLFVKKVTFVSIPNNLSVINFLLLKQVLEHAGKQLGINMGLFFSLPCMKNFS
jgi:hypothetical protein